MNTRTKILFLASNPDDVKKLNLDEEIHAITAKIRTADYRDVLDLIPRFAVRADDLQQELLQQKPAIVHFSGHGSKSGELVLMDNSRQTKFVNPATLKDLFSIFSKDVKLVVLNACYTKTQGEAIAEVIDCVIGTNESIGDEAAIAFATAFYRAIGFACSVETAYKLGKNSLMLEGIPEENTLELLHRPGVNPASIYLVDQWQSQSDVVGVNLEVARSIHGFGPIIASANYDRKQKVADYYQKIANTLKEVVTSLRANQKPSGNCQKMYEYADQLPSTIGDLIGISKANDLSQKLKHAYDVESLFNLLDNVADREASLEDLEKAAAYFEVAADSLLASP